MRDEREVAIHAGGDEGKTAAVLCDMHCHLDFAANGAALAARAAVEGRGAFSATVTPAGYEAARTAFSACANVRVGLGLHPWWVADGTCGEADVERFEAWASDAPFIGEIGLDFAPRRAETREVQLAVFERAVRAGLTGGKVATLHAVRSADVVLDVLERQRSTADNACILHWFSGTSDELQRAVRLGCQFSVSARMLATKRGRAYVRAIPTDRLLLETDWPSQPAGAVPYEEWTAALAETARLLDEARGEGAAHIAAENGVRLLGLR